MSDSDSSKNSVCKDFELNYDTDNEFQVNQKNRKKPSKNDQIYGIFNESSGEENNEKNIFNFTKKNQNNYSNFVHGKKTHLNDELNNEGVKVILKTKKEKVQQELIKDFEGKQFDFEEIEKNMNFLNKKKNKLDEEINDKDSDFIESDIEDKDSKQTTSMPRNFGKTKEIKIDKKLDKIKKKVEEDDLTGKEKEYSQIYGKAFKMLKKTGFKFGEEGLGKNRQGILEPIKITKTEGKQGISYDNVPIKTEKINKENSTNKITEKIDQDEYDKLINNWEEIKKQLSQSDNYEEIGHLVDFTKLLLTNKTLKDNNLKIVDMRGPRASIINSLSEVLSINERLKTENLDVNEVKGKLVFLMKKCKYKIGSYFNQLKHMDDMRFASSFELNGLKKEIYNIEQRFASQRIFEKDLNKTIKILENLSILSENDILLVFEKLFLNNKEEYIKHRNLTLVCVKLLIGKYKSNKYSLEQYLERKDEFIKEFIQIQKFINITTSQTFDLKEDEDTLHIFQKNKENEEDINMNEKVFSLFLHEVFISDVINYIINQWKTKDSYFLTDIIDGFRKITPKNLMDYVINSAILPRITEEIKTWSPSKTKEHIHTWFHLWLPTINTDKLEYLFGIIQNKLAEFVITWHPSDSTLLTILQPWKKIFNKVFWTSFTKKYILPKLTYQMERLIIDPSDQDINPIIWLLDWEEFISEEYIIKILVDNFFPKWLNTLNLWFSKKFDIKEVFQWYTGWKGFFPSKLVQNQEINNLFKVGLEIIHKHL